MKKHRRIQLERLERRELLAADLSALLGPDELSTYSFDGSGNNELNPQWGSVGESLLRLSPADYADGIAAPAGQDRPSAREISNALSDTGDEDVISDRELSAFIYAWGQFIDHDIGLTPTGTSEQVAIEVPQGDPYFDPFGTGTEVISTNRSIYDPATGTGVDNPREQINTITAWIDGSMIYGSDETTAAALRTFEGGKLKLTEDGLLPLNNVENFPDGTVPLVNDAHRVPDDELFAAGDVRANENIELTSLHTLFVREHNRWADQLAAQNPALSDEQLYQRARMMVIAEIQSITYNEWLPAVLGRSAVSRYEGYDPGVNPGLSNEFSTAAFRFGHSLLGDDVEFLDDNGREVGEEIPLSEAFFNPTILEEESIDSIFKYLASDPSSELDLLVVGSLRNFLFGPPGAGGLDLASLNIERGRDHGLSDYNSVRESLGLDRVESFAEISSDPEVQQKLETLYGSVDNVDLWVGALAEDHEPGSSVGATLTAIIGDQFERLRDGDRFWYQNALRGSLLRDVENTSLTDVMRRNTDLQNLQENAFFFRAEIGGRVYADLNRNEQRDRGDQRLEGWTVELVSETSGETIATAVTDARGRYNFDVQSGVRTDTYFARLSLDAAGNPVDHVSRLVSITRGDQRIRGLDLPVPSLADPPRPDRPDRPGPGPGPNPGPGQNGPRDGMPGGSRNQDPTANPGGANGDPVSPGLVPSPTPEFNPDPLFEQLGNSRRTRR